MESNLTQKRQQLLNGNLELVREVISAADMMRGYGSTTALITAQSSFPTEGFRQPPLIVSLNSTQADTIRRMSKLKNPYDRSSVVVLSELFQKVVGTRRALLFDIPVIRWVADAAIGYYSAALTFMEAWQEEQTRNSQLLFRNESLGMENKRLRAENDRLMRSLKNLHEDLT